VVRDGRSRGQIPVAESGTVRGRRWRGDADDKDGPRLSERDVSVDCDLCGDNEGEGASRGTAPVGAGSCEGLQIRRRRRNGDVPWKRWDTFPADRVLRTTLAG